MNLPDFEICIEGYNTEQVDYYIGRILEENATLKKEYLSFVKSINESMFSRFEFTESSLFKINSRLSQIEKALDINRPEIQPEPEAEVSENPIAECEVLTEPESENKEDFSKEIADLKNDLESLKELFNK